LWSTAAPTALTTPSPTRDDRRLAGAADVAVEVGAHRDPRFDVELDAVLSDALEQRRLDDLGVHRGLQRFEHVAAREVDRRRALPLQRNLRALRRDHRQRHLVDVAARQDVRLQLIDGERQPGLARAHQVRDEQSGRHADDPHADERADRERHTGRHRANPQTEREIVEK
jgi:hypothetical protein